MMRRACAPLWRHCIQAALRRGISTPSRPPPGAGPAWPQLKRRSESSPGAEAKQRDKSSPGVGEAKQPGESTLGAEAKQRDESSPYVEAKQQAASSSRGEVEAKQYGVSSPDVEANPQAARSPRGEVDAKRQTENSPRVDATRQTGSSPIIAQVRSESSPEAQSESPGDAASRDTTTLEAQKLEEERLEEVRRLGRDGAEDEEPVEDVVEAGPGRTYVVYFHALSPNVMPSDFYRLDSNVMAGMKSCIAKVLQQRNPLTLEPSGRFHLYFTSAASAASYRRRIWNLHYMSRYRFRSPTGLTPNPLHPARLLADFTPASRFALLHNPSRPNLTHSSHPDPTHHPDDMDLTGAAEAAVQAYALAPACAPTIISTRMRQRPNKPPKWAVRLDHVVAARGFSAKPSALLVHVYPPTLSSQQLGAFIRADGWCDAGAWRVGEPYHLKPESADVEGVYKTQEEDSEGAYKKQEQDSEGVYKKQEQDSEGASGTKAGHMQGNSDALDASHENAQTTADAQTTTDAEPAADSQPFQEWRKNPYYNDFATPEKQWCRFVVPCASEPEARRFHRYWNQRVLVSGRGPYATRNTVRTSILKW